MRNNLRLSPGNRTILKSNQLKKNGIKRFKRPRSLLHHLGLIANQRFGQADVMGNIQCQFFQTCSRCCWLPIFRLSDEGASDTLSIASSKGDF